MKRHLALAAGLLCAACLTGPAAAQVAADGGPTRVITVPKDKSAAFRLDYPVGEIVVAQPDTLELVATTDQSFYVRGKQVGVTNILIYDRMHHLAQVVDARVGYDTESLQADLATALPGETVHVSDFAGGLLLTGEVSTSRAAARAMEIAERYAPKQVQCDLKIKSAQQVMVEVRILEVKKTALKDLGVNLGAQAQNPAHFNFSSGNGLITSGAPQGILGISGSIDGVSINATLAALEERGAVHTLAKPNLVAMSGEEASFLAGGEFPFPIPNGTNGTNIEFRTYGVKLNIIPTVEDNGEIRLKVAPEVSQLDPAGGVTIQGFVIPGISTRRAATSVELRDGQSFAIAGLFEKDTTASANQIPGLGQLPVLGALFKSVNWQKNETELVIIVTPHLTAPADSLDALPDPLRGVKDPTVIDLILAGKGFDDDKGVHHVAAQ